LRKTLVSDVGERRESFNPSFKKNALGTVAWGLV
jgi:hypothetical protein